MIFDQSYNASFHQKPERSQYSGPFATTEAILGTSKEKILNGLGLKHYKIDAGTENCLVYTKLLLTSLLVIYSA